MSKYIDWGDLRKRFSGEGYPLPTPQPATPATAGMYAKFWIGDTVKVTSEFVSAILSRPKTHINHMRGTTIQPGDTLTVDSFVGDHMILIHEAIRIVASAEEVEALETIPKDEPPVEDSE